MADIRELKDQAAKHFSKGKFEKAASAYEELCRLEPKDMQMRVRLGDALVKAGNKEKAVSAYRVAAETYAKDGFLPRAIAVCKLILEVDPSHSETQNVLAQLYAKKTAAPPARPAGGPVPPAPSRPAPARPVAAAPPATPKSQPNPAGEEPLELDTGARAFDTGVKTPDEPELEAVTDSGLELDTAGEGASWKGSSVAWEPPATPGPKAPGPKAPEPQAPDRPVAPPPPASWPPTAPAGPVVAGPAKTPVPPPPPSWPPSAPITTPPAKAAVARPPAPPPSKPLTAPVQVAPPPPAPKPTAPPPGVRPAAPPAVPPAPIAEALELSFDAEPELPESVKQAEPMTLVELEMGEPELLGLQSRPPMPTWTAPAGPVVADSLAEAIAVAQAGEASAAEPAAPAAAEVPPGQVQTWFAEPEGTREDGRKRPTLADLALVEVDEEEEIEILTITVDQPVDAAALPEIPLFSDLSREAFVDLASQCSLKRCTAGEVVVEQGTVGTSFFVVTSGSVKVVKKAEGGDLTLARLTEGAFFGEMALLSGVPRAASVVAEDEAECLEISAELLSSLVKRYPHVGQALKKFCRQRLLSNVMATSPLFRPFGKDDRKGLIEKFKAREVAEQEVVLTEGEPADGLYVVMMGELEVRKQTGAEVQRIAALKEGDVFGEISLLTKSPATATVAAVRRSTILRLPRTAFDELISTHPQILMLVSELSDERLRAQQSFQQSNVASDGLLLL